MSRKFGGIDTSVYSSDECVGSPSGGNPFAITSYAAVDAVQQFSILAKDQYISQVSVKMPDGYQMTVGKGGSNVGLWNFSSGEKLTSIKLHSNGKGLTGVDIRTTKQHIEAFAEGGEATASTAIPVGNGNFVGIFGYAGGRVDSLGVATRK